MTSANTKNLLENYKKVEKEKEERIKQVVEEYLSQSDQDEEESKHYSKFAEQGSDAIKVMTGFTTAELLELYGVVEKSLKVTGRGKKPEIGPLDAFFLTLVMLKHYESWDKFALSHGVKKNVVVNCIHKTLTKIKEPLCKALLVLITKDEQMKKGIKFDDYPEVGLVVDVTFQVRTKPKMLFKEAQFYFSGKHSAYGLKTEVAHLPNGLAVFVSNLYGGSVHDFTIFKDNIEIYKSFLEKKSTEARVEDKGELKDKYPKSWALMADKGYQGAAELIRAIIPKKGKDLTREDNARIKKIAKDRVICENFYGRMKKLFKIMELKFKWDENTYSDVFNVCVALTNFHIIKYPLRNEDGIYYKGVLNGYTNDAIEKKRKKKEQNEKYAKKKKDTEE